MQADQVEASGEHVAVRKEGERYFLPTPEGEGLCSVTSDEARKADTSAFGWKRKMLQQALGLSDVGDAYRRRVARGQVG